MIVKRYFTGTVDTSVQEHVEIREQEVTQHATLTDAEQYIFTHKLAGTCDGYEIFDLQDVKTFYKLHRDHSKWQELQSATIKSWYDRSAMAGTRPWGCPRK